MVRIKNKFIKIMLMLILMATMLATITTAQSEQAQRAGYHSTLYTSTITDYNGSEPIVILNGLISQDIRSNQFCLGSNCISEWSNITSGIGESKWEESGANIYRISGKVGLGDTTPDYKLEVLEETNTQPVAVFRNTGGGSGSVRGTGYVGFGISDAWNIGSYIGWDQESTSGYRQAMTFGTRGNNDVFPTERMRITSGGDVGIGINPSQPLHVYHATLDNVAHIESGDANARLALSDSSTTAVGYVSVSAVGNDMALYAGASERMRLDSSGNVGIGTLNPQKRLHIHNSGLLISGNQRLESDPFEPRLIVDAGASTAHSLMDLRNERGSALYVYGTNSEAVGRVGINTNNPSQALDVNGNIRANRVDVNLAQLGLGANVDGDTSRVAIGQASLALGVFSSAFGSSSIAVASRSTSIGYGSRADYEYSTAIGTGAQTTNTNQIRLGRAADTVSIPGNLRVQGQLLDVGKRSSTSCPQITIDGTSYSGIPWGMGCVYGGNQADTNIFGNTDQAYVECPSGMVGLTGGCRCDGNRIEANAPAFATRDAWFCQCRTKEDSNFAWIVCI